MKEDAAPRRVVMRNAMAVCCALWVPVVRTRADAKNAATSVDASVGIRVSDSDSGAPAVAANAPPVS